LGALLINRKYNNEYSFTMQEGFYTEKELRHEVQDLRHKVNMKGKVIVVSALFIL